MQYYTSKPHIVCTFRLFSLFPHVEHSNAHSTVCKHTHTSTHVNTCTPCIRASKAIMRRNSFNLWWLQIKHIGDARDSTPFSLTVSLSFSFTFTPCLYSSRFAFFHSTGTICRFDLSFKSVVGAAWIETSFDEKSKNVN